MVHLRLLKVKHPNVILVYSVPTKQVLKRVGQECEAHAHLTGPPRATTPATARFIRCVVRTPSAIRRATGRRCARRLRSARSSARASGTIEQQLEYAADVGYKLKDRGAGKPDIIIADLNTTASLLKAAHNAKESSFYHKNNILLYFDEPNMGIHLDPNVLGVVSTIQSHMPLAAVLASATLGPWEDSSSGGAGPCPRGRSPSASSRTICQCRR